MFRTANSEKALAVEANAYPKNSITIKNMQSIPPSHRFGKKWLKTLTITVLANALAKTIIITNAPYLLVG